MALITYKAAKLDAEESLVSVPSFGTFDTVVVPSKFNPKKPHIVN